MRKIVENSKQTQHLLVTLSIVFLASSLFSQNKMIVDQSYGGGIYYGAYTREIKSLSQVPVSIRTSAITYLQKILGTMSSNVTFFKGEINDLEKYEKADPVNAAHIWRPKYDLTFILRDSILGIKKYYLNLLLDAKGVVQISNWPKEGYADRQNFISKSEIEQFVIQKAKQRGLKTDNYKLGLVYNENLDRLCWSFRFLEKEGKYNNDYYTFEIDTGSLTVVDEFKKTGSKMF